MTSEADPLLPRTNPPPEVHSSRARGVNDIGDVNQDTDDMIVDGSEPRISSTTLRWLGAGCIVLLVILLLPFNRIFKSPGHRHDPPTTIEGRVDKILSDTPLIDGHNDLAILIRAMYNNHINNDSFGDAFLNGGMPAHVDLPRLEEGKNGGAFWSAFVPCPKDGLNFSDENYAESVQFTLTQIDLLHRLISHYPSHFHAPSLPASTFTNRTSQLISPLAIEGLHQIGNSASNLRLYHSLGVRYATLTHNCHNIYTDAALLEASGPGDIEVAKPYWGGVSRAGRKLIREMNRLGMIVDLSHTSHATQLDVLGANHTSGWGGSLAPPIFSHSSAYALCPHPRNVKDSILNLVARRNGVVMVNFSPDFISCTTADPPNKSGLPNFDAESSTLEHVVDHIVYIGSKIGWEYVGLGSDFDGIPSTPRGLDDVSKFPDLVAELLRRGVSDEDAAKVVGGNILRVWREVEEVGKEMRQRGEEPLEDGLKDLFE